MTRTRILITGARDWENRDTIWRVLTGLANKYGILIVTHGGCPPLRNRNGKITRTGADHWAHEWVRMMATTRSGHTEDPHPANWKTLGKAAGPTRNQSMITLNPVEVHAFPLEHSPGTWDTMQRAEAVGIPVHNHGVPRPRCTTPIGVGLFDGDHDTCTRPNHHAGPHQDRNGQDW